MYKHFNMNQIDIGSYVGLHITCVLGWKGSQIHTPAQFEMRDQLTLMFSWH